MPLKRESILMLASAEAGRVLLALGVGLGSVDLVAGDNVFEDGGTAGQDRIVLACKGRLEEQEQDKLD